LLARFVADLAGFGTSLIAAGIWLHAVSPPLASAVTCAAHKPRPYGRPRAGGARTDIGRRGSPGPIVPLGPSA
jgi:hypothetical protein